MRKTSLHSFVAMSAAILASASLSNVARADGSEIVTGIAPASPAPAPESPPDPVVVRPAAPSTDDAELGARAPVALQPSARLAAFLLGGVAVAGAGAGITFGVLALNDKSSFDAHPTYHTGEMANEYAVLSDVCLGGAVVAAVTSLVLILRHPEAPTPDDATRAWQKSAIDFTVSPMIVRQGGGAGAALRF